MKKLSLLLLCVLLSLAILLVSCKPKSGTDASAATPAPSDGITPAAAGATDDALSPTEIPIADAIVYRQDENGNFVIVAPEDITDDMQLYIMNADGSYTAVEKEGEDIVLPTATAANTAAVITPKPNATSVPMTPVYTDLIPAMTSTFTGASTAAASGWAKSIGSPTVSISAAGNPGNCLKFRPNNVSFASPQLDLRQFISEAGSYTVSFDYRADGSWSGAPFAVAIRSNAGNSFISENGGNYYLSWPHANEKSESGQWYTYIQELIVTPSDLKGGPSEWLFCLHMIASGVSSISLDNFTLKIERGTTTKVTSAQTWVTEELQLASSKFYDDPFNAVDVDLILQCGTRTLTVPGFWDGGVTWRVRFACPVAGTWSYRTVCSDTSNKGLHNVTGTFRCTPYSGSLDIYKHGFVKTVNGTRYFLYDDGTPFFYLGDTHWSLGDETEEIISAVCKQRVKQNFTVIQSEPIGASFNLENGLSSADIPGLREYDKKFQIIASSGLVHANAEFFFPSQMDVLIKNMGGYSSTRLTRLMGGSGVAVYDLSDSVKAYLKKLSRYWVARYGAYPVMWTLGQEVDNDFYWSPSSHGNWNFLNSPYVYAAKCIQQYDPYSHPLTGHQENTWRTRALGNGYGEQYGSATIYTTNADVLPSAFRGVTAHTWYGAQWSPIKNGQLDFNVVKDYWYNGEGKVCVNYEGQYCYLWTKNFGARMQGWTAYLNGMFGQGFGAQDTWSYTNTYNEDADSSDGVDTITSAEKKAATWEDSLSYPSAFQLGYMHTFFSGFDWYNLIPRFDDSKYFSPASNKVYYSIASNQANTKIVVYFYNFTDPTVAAKVNSSDGTSTGTLKNLAPNARYNYQWFNPITGKVVSSGSFTATSGGTHSIGAKATCDMVYYVYKA